MKENTGAALENTPEGTSGAAFPKRSNAIDLVRIVIALTVVAVHAAELVAGAGFAFGDAISVFMEFFFMLSGFFMMSRIDRPRGEDETAWGFVLHKLKGFCL